MMFFSIDTTFSMVWFVFYRIFYKSDRDAWTHNLVDPCKHNNRGLLLENQTCFFYCTPLPYEIDNTQGHHFHNVGSTFFFFCGATTLQDMSWEEKWTFSTEVQTNSFLPSFDSKWSFVQLLIGVYSLHAKRFYILIRT